MKWAAAALLIGFMSIVSADLAASHEYKEPNVPEGLRLVTPQMHAELVSSQAPRDTVYVGYTPGKFNATNNWWSIGAGSGAGFHAPPAQGGMWDFETPVNGDSLQGWWPIRNAYTSTGGLTRTDRNRAWWANDVR